MNSVWAIALISIRNAVRSKLVVVLLLFLLVVLIGLPVTVRGDGTMAGHVRLLLRYTLGLATLILSVATVWAACAAIATEIRDRSIQMVLSKPVHAWQLWLGKWLGLTALNALLLALCAGITYGALRWTTQPQKLTEEEYEELHGEILLSQRRLTPIPVDIRDEVRQQFDQIRARGDWPDDISASQLLELIEREIRAQVNAVPPGTFNRWTFNVPKRPPPDRPLLLRYRFAVSVLDLQTVPGIWTFGVPGTPGREQVLVEDAPRAWGSLFISPDAIGPDGTLTIEYANVDGRAITVLFDPEEDLRLMVYEGGFLLNYARAILLILIHLAFLAAIGTTASAFFSVPVAALSSFYALLLLNAGRFVGRLAERDVSIAQGPDVHWLATTIDALTFSIYRGLNLLIEPVSSANPLDFIAVGEWIGWGEVAHMGLVKVVIYSGLLMLFGVFHLSRKEVALPA